MNTTGYEKIFILTSPIFWVYAAIAYIIHFLRIAWAYSTIGDWLTMLFTINAWGDDALNRIIKINNRKPDTIPWYHKQREYMWVYGAKKAQDILNKRDNSLTN